MGRADDIIKISGHRIGSAELEAAITSHPAVAEAMAIGVPDKLKGESIVAYIILKKEYQSSNKNSEAESKLRGEIIRSVVNGIGNFARPEQITFVNDLPRTATGKTVRRKIASTNNTSITRCLSVEIPMLEEVLNHYHDLHVTIDLWASTV